MKTNKKTMWILLAFIPLVVLLYSFRRPEITPQYATIRTVEVNGWASGIVLSYEGKTEELELDRMTRGTLVPNSLKITQAINMLAGKGYKLVAQSGGDYISVYTFELIQ